MGEESDLIGKQIGNYRLIEVIASGSFGTVYRAHHIYLTTRIVALKVLHMHLPAKERERFIQEAQFLEKLQHRHILSIVDMGFDNGRPYLASAYASGGSLRQRLNQTPLLPWGQALIILTQIGEALHYAHQQNIVHCDLKPENILFNAQGEAVLADFGIATVLSTMSVKQLADLKGTPSYMAPEQFHGQVSKEMDQYALGCIAYELVTGQQVFSAPSAFPLDSLGFGMYTSPWGRLREPTSFLDPLEGTETSLVVMVYKHETEQPVPPRQINPQIAAYIEEAILKALAKQRSDRHRDVAAFLKALQTYPPLQPPLQGTRKEWLGTGDALCNLRRYEEALFAYEQALRIAPNSAYIYTSKGIILRNLKRYEEAVEAYEQALRLDPNDINAYNGKANTLCDLSRYEEALLAYEQALRLDPNDADAYNGKGNALYDLGQYKEALFECEQALRLDPSNALAYNNKGTALHNLKQYEEALVAYEQAIRLDPNNALAYNNKGVSLRKLKRYKEALEAYEQALRLDPNLVYAYTGRGTALHDLKRYEEALVTYEQALRLDPNFAYAYYNKGLTLDCLGRSIEAQQVREQARKLGLA